MKNSHSILTVLTAILAWGLTTGEAQAAAYSFTFSGPSVSGALTLNYGAAMDAKTPGAYEVTSITGTFSDTALGIVNATAGALVPITHDAPETTNLLAPNDFSSFAVATGLAHGSISFDNLYYPSGSPQTATDYPVFGGFLDIYGLMFSIGGGRDVNLWSNGAAEGAADYGVAVVTSAQALDYVAGGLVAAVPELDTYWMLSGGLLAMLAWRRRSSNR